jgi:hypothetical protein
MIQPQTLLILADNSGARKLVCIRVIWAATNQDMLFKGNFSQITYMRKIERYRYEMDPKGPLDIMVHLYILRKHDIKVGDKIVGRHGSDWGPSRHHGDEARPDLSLSLTTPEQRWTVWCRGRGCGGSGLEILTWSISPTAIYTNWCSLKAEPSKIFTSQITMFAMAPKKSRNHMSALFFCFMTDMRCLLEIL